MLKPIHNARTGWEYTVGAAPLAKIGKKFFSLNRPLALFLIVSTLAFGHLQIAEAQSPEVKVVQTSLIEMGYDPGSADGFMGPRTQKALKAFQRDQGLEMSGLLDSKTRALLAERVEKVRSEVSQPEPTTPVSGAPSGSDEYLSTSDQPAAPTTTISSPQVPATHNDSSNNIYWYAAIGSIILLAFWRRKKQKVKRSAKGIRNPKPDRQRPTFQASPQLRRTPDKTAAAAITPVTWYPAGASATVAGRALGDLIYVGSPTHRYGDQDHGENHVIDPSLKVGSGAADKFWDDLSYWPSYSEIPANSRLVYLEWLSGGRDNLDINIGYVFLYFYGLEKRLFADDPSEIDVEAILGEVRRLKEIYNENGSFKRYSAALLEAAQLLPGVPMDEEPVFKRNGGWEIPLCNRINIGQQIVEGSPLAADWMLAWWLTHPDVRQRMPVRRAGDEFRSLFRIRFDQKHPRGLKIRRPARKLDFQYRAASGSFSRDFTEDLRGIPEIGQLTKPLSTVASIAEECCDDLDSFSRFLGRNPDSHNSLEAHALLPPDLRDVISNASLDDLRQWVSKRIDQDQGIVRVETIIERLEGQLPERVSRRSLVNAADVLASFAVGLAPDPRFALKAPRIGEPVVLFHLPAEVRRITEPSAEYRRRLLLLTLGTLVAHADGSIVQAERDRLSLEISNTSDLSVAEKSRLKANLQWFLAIPPDLALLRKALKNTTIENRQRLGQLAIAVAHADRIIHPNEIKTIEKIYKAMGLPTDTLYGDIHKMAAPRSDDRPIVVRRDDRLDGFQIPPPAEIGINKDDYVTLDQDKVAEIIANTAEVSQILGAVFGEEEPPPGNQLDDVESHDDQSRDEPALPPGLDAPHRALVFALIDNSRWTTANFSHLADRFGLLSAGALETINEWAFEIYDDALLEEYGDLELNQDIVAIIASSQTETDGAEIKNKTA